MIDGESISAVWQFLPVVLIGVLLVVSIWWDGAFDLRYWAPLTILGLCILLALTLAGTLELPRRGPLTASVAIAWCFAAFVLLTAAWAKSPSAAWTEGARSAFYATIWTLAAGSGARGVWRGRLGGALAGGLGIVALLTLIHLLADGQGYFLAGRLDSPIGYRNGTAALFAFGAWPLIGFAARRGGSSGARAAAFSAAVLAIGLAFLTQSRGVAIGIVLGGAVSLAIGPDRVRRSWLAILAVAAVGAVAGPLLTPYHAFTGGTLVVGSGDIRHAAWALLAIAAVAFLGALLYAVYDNGLRSGEADRRFRQAAIAGLVLVALGAGAAALAKVGDPVSYAHSKLDEFNEEEGSSSGSTRLGSVGGERSDLWRVAWDQFKEDPIAGAGAGSYEFSYYENRHTDRNLSDAHSLPLRLLADTGLIGFGLFAAWMVAAGWAIARRARESLGGERMWIAGLAAAGTTVLAQCLADWLWLLPALLGISFLALGLAAAGGREEAAPSSAPRWTPLRIAAAAGVGATVLSVTFLFLGNLYVRKAEVDSYSSPEAELSAARTAAFFTPVSVTPLYLEASALESEGRRGEAKAKLEDALSQEPDNFVTLGLLGDFEVRGGNEARARAYYREALALNPLDVGLRKLSEGAE